MSLGEYALAGGQDLVTTDVLTDSHTTWLDDLDGGSGIHDDFLGLVPGVLVDTHFVTRARLGRLAGTLARAIDDGAPRSLVGLGIDEQTCAEVLGDEIRVSGVGVVVRLQAGAEDPVRIAGEPLVWAGLPLDRWTDGWRATIRGAGEPPDDAEPVDPAPSGPPADVAWSLDGRRPADEDGFQWVIHRAPDPFEVVAGTGRPTLPGALGVADAFDSDRRYANDEALFRALYEHPGATGFAVGDGAALEHRAGDGGAIRTEDGPRGPMSTLVIDTSAVTARSLSPWVSPADSGDGALHAAGIAGATLSVLDVDVDGRGWDLVRRAPTTP